MLFQLDAPLSCPRWALWCESPVDLPGTVWAGETQQPTGSWGNKSTLESVSGRGQTQAVWLTLQSIRKQNYPGFLWDSSSLVLYRIRHWGESLV